MFLLETDVKELFICKNCLITCQRTSFYVGPHMVDIFLTTIYGLYFSHNHTHITNYNLFTILFANITPVGVSFEVAQFSTLHQQLCLPSCWRTKHWDWMVIWLKDHDLFYAHHTHIEWGLFYTSHRYLTKGSQEKTLRSTGLNCTLS